MFMVLCITVQWMVTPAVFSQLDAEMAALQQRLGIPGLALAVVDADGLRHQQAFGVQRDGESFTIDTPLRIASVTKTLTATLVMQEVTRGRLNLDQAVVDLAPVLKCPPEVTVRHLLTHTSEGRPGQEYVYGTTRFNMLVDVLEASSDLAFSELLEQRILKPSGMKTYVSPDLGASWGLVSTTSDLAKFAHALETGNLLDQATLKRMAQPVVNDRGVTQPIGLGVFTQEIHGVRVVWSFGQDDPDHSGLLFLRVPERRLTFILFANDNRLSDPFRLMMGDLRQSPFAMAFLRLFVASPKPNQPIIAPDWRSETLETQLTQTHHDFGHELFGNAIVELWASQSDPTREFHARALFALHHKHYPWREPNIVQAFYAGILGEDPYLNDGLAMAKRLVTNHPDNRWLLANLGELHLAKDHQNDAAKAFKRMISIPNQQDDGVHRIIQRWGRLGLGQALIEQDPVLAKKYLQQLLDSGAQGDIAERARRLLAEH